MSSQIIESKKDEISITKSNNYIIIEEKKNSESNHLPPIKQDDNIQASKLSGKAIVYKKILEQSIVSDDLISKENSPKINEENILLSKNKVEINKVKNISSEISAVARERDRSSEMVIKAIRNSWVEIEDIDGNSLMARIMRPGETFVVPNISGLTFNTGNAGALSLSYGDVTISSLIFGLLSFETRSSDTMLFFNIFLYTMALPDNLETCILLSCFIGGRELVSRFFFSSIII